MTRALLVTVVLGWSQPVAADRRADDRASYDATDDRSDRASEASIDDRDHAPSARPWDAVPRVAPAVADVVAAAYRAAGLDRAPGRALARRARLAGLVPYVSVRTVRDTSWRDGEHNVGRGLTYEVRASWRLDRLVFDGRELAAAGLEAARRRERRSLASQVIRSYFRWRRAARTGQDGEAAAELDALTDGWFSTALGEVRRTASETRTARPPPDPPTPTP